MIMSIKYKSIRIFIIIEHGGNIIIETLNNDVKFVIHGAQVVAHGAYTAIKGLIDALKELHPNEYIEYEKCFNQSYHYAYNLMAVRGEVYKDYCEWVFGITSYLEKLNLESINGFRILGYIVEQLTSIYFIANTNKLKIKHVKKEIYV